MAGKKDAHKSDSSSAKWCFLVYEEHLDEVINLIKERKLMCSMSPSHDRDKREDGTIKKAHRHCIYKTANGRSIAYSTAVRDLQGIAVNNEVQVCNNQIGNERYFCHLDDGDKELYNEEEILTFNGYELAYSNTDSEVERKIYEILFEVYLPKYNGNLKAFIAFLKKEYPNEFPCLFHFVVKNTYFLGMILKEDK